MPWGKFCKSKVKTGWVATTQAPATVTIRAHHTDNPSHKNKLIFFDFSEIISRLMLQLRHSLASTIQRNMSVELQFIIHYNILLYIIKFFTISLHCIRSLKRSSARYFFHEDLIGNSLIRQKLSRCIFPGYNLPSFKNQENYLHLQKIVS